MRRPSGDQPYGQCEPAPSVSSRGSPPSLETTATCVSSPRLTSYAIDRPSGDQFGQAANSASNVICLAGPPSI